ncbi:MAG: tetratricopeptide repeat protein, partial [Bryocella sp.]
MRLKATGLAALIACCATPMMVRAQSVAAAPPVVAGAQNPGKLALAAEDYVRAKQYFAAQLVAHPGNVKAKLGLAEAELGLTHYIAAETLLREVTAAAPEMWQAHKNLIL